jgi:hypothetical protein
VRSVEFHPDAQAEFISAAQFYERQTEGLGLDFIATVQNAYQRLAEFPVSGAPLAAGSGVFWFRSFPTACCIASSLTASTSSRSCTFTVGQATGGRGFEGGLPNNTFDRTAGAHSLAAAGHR